MILGLGIVLGIFAKWLDNLSIDDSIWWQRILGRWDLNNVFSELGVWVLLAILIAVYSNSSKRAALNVFTFFVGMTVSYHLYTIFVCGFNPLSYMMIWYAITLVSPFLAYIVWYAKGTGKWAFIFRTLIVAFMISKAFNIGIWYIDIKGVLEIVFLLVILFVLFKSFKEVIYSIVIGLIINFMLNLFFYI